MNDKLQIAQLIVTGLLSFATVFIGLLFTYKTKILEMNAAAAERKRENDAQKTNAKLKVIEETTDKVHVLVNAPMAAALLLTKVTTRRIADLTGDAADMAIADRAESDYNDHIKRQAEVDKTQAKKVADSREGIITT